MQEHATEQKEKIRFFGGLEREVDRIIDIKDVISLVTYKRTSIYRMIEEGRFPKQIKLGPRRVGWSLAAIEKWQEERIGKPTATDVEF